MKEIFKSYIITIIKMTFGFIPEVRIDMPNDGVIKIFLDGTESERKQMMGYHATNFNALKQLLICFSKKYQMYVFLFIEFKNETHNTEDTESTF